MSSHAPTVETGVSNASVTVAGIASTTDVRTQFRVERRILCNRIAELERELKRERQRRVQVVDRYERLLEGERRDERQRQSNGGPDQGGLLGRLF